MTVHLFEYLQDKRDDIVELWAAGGFDAPTMEESAMLNATGRGIVSALDQILTLEATFLSEDK